MFPLGPKGDSARAVVVLWRGIEAEKKNDTLMVRVTVQKERKIEGRIKCPRHRPLFKFSLQSEYNYPK